MLCLFVVVLDGCVFTNFILENTIILKFARTIVFDSNIFKFARTIAFDNYTFCRYGCLVDKVSSTAIKCGHA